MFPTAGSKIYIGGALAEKAADFTSSDFSSVTWVEIGGVESLGAFGDTSEAITTATIGDSRSRVVKGVRNAGTLELVCVLNYADDGQADLIAAEKTSYAYAFKIEFNDKPSTGASPKNSTRRFIAKVMSASEALSDANSVMKLNAALAINSNIVRTDASET